MAVVRSQGSNLLTPKKEKGTPSKYFSRLSTIMLQLITPKNVVNSKTKKTSESTNTDEILTESWKPNDGVSQDCKLSDHSDGGVSLSKVLFNHKEKDFFHGYFSSYHDHHKNNSAIIDAKSVRSDSTKLSFLPQIGFVIKIREVKSNEKVFINVFHHDIDEDIPLLETKHCLDHKNVSCLTYDVLISSNLFKYCEEYLVAKNAVGYYNF